MQIDAYRLVKYNFKYDIFILAFCYNQQSTNGHNTEHGIYRQKGKSCTFYSIFEHFITSIKCLQKNYVLNDVFYYPMQDFVFFYYRKI